MSLTNILIFTLLGVIFVLWLPRRWRGWILLLVSILSVYWMQPSTALRNWDFWFPTASILLTILVWAITSREHKRAGLITGLFIFGVVLAIAGHYLSNQSA